MATITKRGARQWQVRVRRAGYPEQCQSFETKARAESWARSVENEMDRGIWVDRSESEATTLADALDRYGREVTPNKKHAGVEAGRVKRLMDHPLALLPLSRVRGVDVARYIADRVDAGAGGNTVRLELAILSHLFSVAASAWGMEGLANPVANAKHARPRVPGGRERRLQPGECGALLGASSLRFAEVAAFAIETAMRQGELARMEWRHVDLARRSVFIPVTKNTDARTVPLSPAALEILAGLPHRVGPVWEMTESAMRQAMDDARDRAGITNLKFHDLRHEAISRLFENTDLDVMEIRAISGHRTMQMLARYTHLRTARLADRLAGAPRVAIK